MENEKGQKAPEANRGEGRQRLRESGSQTDDDAEHVDRLDVMNAKLDELLAACREIKSIKNEVSGLREELKGLKESLEFAEKEIECLKEKMADTTTTIKEHNEDTEFFEGVIDALKWRNIKLEAYTRRENIKIFNVKEESGENTEELFRKLFVTKLQIPNKDVTNIRFESAHRIPSRAPDRRSSRPRPVIARFSFYQEKEFVRSFCKNLKGTDIGIAHDFPREIEEIHKTLYPVLKKAKREQQRAYFNFDKLIIDGRIYRGKEIFQKFT